MVSPDQPFIPTDITYLRTEASVATPTEERELQENAQDILDTFIELWGKHMPPSTLNKLQQMQGRIIVVDEQTLPRIATYFDRDLEIVDTRPFGMREQKINAFEEAAADFYAQISCWKAEKSGSISTPHRDGNIRLYFHLLDVFGKSLHDFYFGKETALDIDDVLMEIDDSSMEHLAQVYKENEGNTESELLESYSQASGLAFKQYGLVVLLKEDVWEYFPSVIQRRLRIKQVFTGMPFPKKITERARKKINGEVLNHRMAHEIAHILQADTY